jgi:putative DNA primase/helicase
MKLKGISFKEAARMVEDNLGDAEFESPKAKISEGLRRSKLNNLWGRSYPIERGDPVGRYLTTRLNGLEVFPDSLHTVDELEYWDGSTCVGTWPAMVAMVMAPAPSKAQLKALRSDGSNWEHTPVTIHRTWVTKDGQKAPLDDPRRLMPGDTPVGSYIPLSPSESVMGIAEGIETALAATKLFGITCWAAINARNLMHWNPPPRTEHVVVFGDADRSYTGQAAAYELARRLSLQEKIETQVRIPPTLGTDWNDVLLSTGDKLVSIEREKSAAARLHKLEQGCR